MRRIFLRMLGFWIVGAIVLSLHAQQSQPSLNDLAKKAEAARAAAKTKSDAAKSDETTTPTPAGKSDETKPASKPTKVYTNKDLKDVPGPVLPALSEVSESPKTPAAASPQTEATRQADYRQTAKKDEAYWKARMRELQARLANDTAALAESMKRLATYQKAMKDTERLTNGVYVVDRQAKQKVDDTNDEVGRQTTLVEIDTRAVSDLEEEARRADVPPGWLRP